MNKAFKTWDNLISAAGFEAPKKSKDEIVLERRIEQYGARKDIHTRYKEEIIPYIGKYDKPIDKNVLTVASCSDLHSVYMDHFCWDVFVDHCIRLQPDVIGLVGDIFDFYEVSRYDKNPRRVIKLQAEIDYVIEHVFKRIRTACPNSQIDFFLGNHEWRLFKYLCSQATGLSSLRCLKFTNLFELEKFKINLVARPNFLTMDRKRPQQNYKIYGDSYVLSHGTSFSKFSADKELRRYNKTGASGHVHRNNKICMTDLEGSKSWTSLGMMSRYEVAEDYIFDLENWQQGYQMAHIDLDKKLVVTEYVEINNGFACAGGRYYFKEKK